MKAVDISVFRDYPKGHPIRLMLEKGYDADCRPIMNPVAIPATNAMQALCRPLSALRACSEEAYDSFIRDKLVARKGRDDVELHNLLSALCELSVMYTFIMASDERDAFVYEPRLIEGTRKNVEFSIVVHGKRYHVEVKSANLIKQGKDFQEAMEKTGMVVEPNARILPLDGWNNIAGDTPVLGSLDNKVADFLRSAQEKFPPVSKDAINLLVICWDGSYRKALTALKSKVNGLMTEYTYNPDLQYDHVSHVLVSTAYGVIWEWLQGRTTFPISTEPFNMRFHENYLIDYGLDTPSDIRVHLHKTLSCLELPVVDEAYVSENCDEVLFTFDTGR